MLNEGLEDIKNAKTEIIELPLCRKPIFMQLTFKQGAKKRYLLSIGILVEGESITNPIDIEEIMVFCKRFAKKQLNKELHKSNIIKYISKKVNNIERSLKIEIKDKILILNEIDVDILLERVKECLQGYSKVMINRQYSVYSSNSFFCKVNDNFKAMYSPVSNIQIELDNALEGKQVTLDLMEETIKKLEKE